MLLAKRIAFMILGFVLSLMLCSCVQSGGEPRKGYGVFPGSTPEDMEILTGYELAVIDAAYFTKEDITHLHHNGVRVYSYLNIGSLEEFRPFYEEFRDLSLGSYENWSDEYWMDVSEERWIRHIQEQAMELSAKGVDGFFVDNADVYYFYPEEEIYEGLVKILEGLQQQSLDIVINGGDSFVQRAVLDSGEIRITGINQECVFTKIDFENNVFLRQDKESEEYFISYVRRCRENGLDVYLTEYIALSEDGLRGEVREFCRSNQYQCYISASLNLDVGKGEKDGNDQKICRAGRSGEAHRIFRRSRGFDGERHSGFSQCGRVIQPKI